jgi:hypothetical protein
VVGLRFLPTGAEATAPGCLCEGWGAADALSGESGYANESVDGIVNITPISFFTTTTTAVSTVEISTVLRVTHNYYPSPATPYLYEVEVTIENISGNMVEPRYRRVMDWDIEPTAFAEYVTIITGTAQAIAYTSDNGFATANPLIPGGFINFEGEAVDNGPADHGALWDFEFDPLGPGESYTFYTYYGAAPDEVAANGALAAVGAEAYSYGQPSAPYDPAVGDPNTFIFAFGGVGGAPIFPAVALEKTVGIVDGVCATTASIQVYAGREVYYCYTIENTGGVTLTLHTLDDSELGTLFSNLAYNLAPSATVEIIQPAVIWTDTVNTATWTAFNPGPTDVVSSTDVATVTVEPTAFYFIPDVEHLANSVSSVQVVNIGTTDSAITIDYFNPDGTLAETYTDTVPANGSRTYLPVHPAANFDGAAVVEYTGEVAALANYNYLSPLVGASYDGFAFGGDNLVFPLVMKDNNSNDTRFDVQNTTGSAVDITIEFTPEPGMGYDDSIATISDTLPAWSAHPYDLRTLPEFAGVGQWVGSARVEVQGAGEVVGVAQQIDSARDTVTAYSGFLRGSDTVDLPLIMDNNNDMWTSINCQNMGPGDADIMVDFFPEGGYPAKAAVSKLAVPEKGTAVFLQSPAGAQWVGAARVTSANSLACIVNQTNLPQRYASAYQGVNAALRSDRGVAPLIQFQDQGDSHNLWTSVNVQNLDAFSTTVTLDFKPDTGFGDVADVMLDIEPGAVGVFLFYNPYGDGSNAVGGAELMSSNGARLSLVVNQQKVDFMGDYYLTYNGFSR